MRLDDSLPDSLFLSEKGYSISTKSYPTYDCLIALNKSADFQIVIEYRNGKRYHTQLQVHGSNIYYSASAENNWHCINVFGGSIYDKSFPRAKDFITNLITHGSNFMKEIESK